MRQPFPMLTFRCRVTYLTPHGKIGGAVYVVRAIAADLAVDHAETLLRSDKRRNVKQITYTEAIQL